VTTGLRAEDTSYRALLDVPHFARLAGATLLVRTAASMWELALVLFILVRYESPALAGIAVFLSVAPGVLVSPLAGALLDRHGRIRLMVADYTISALALALVVGLSRYDPPLPILLLLIAVASLTNPLGTAGARSLFPLVVPRRLWDRSNAVDSVGYTLTTVIGPPLAGAIVAVTAPEIAILVTAMVYLGGAIVIAGVRDVDDRQDAPGSVIAEARSGLLYVLRHPTLRGLALGLSVMNLAVGVLIVALPVLVFTRLGGSVSAVGGLWAIIGVAGVVTGLIVGRWGTVGRERAQLVAGMAGVAAGCAVLVAAGSLPLVVVGVALVGAATGGLDVALFSLRQRVTDPAWFGRAFAVSMHLNYSGIPIGAALAGPLLAVSLTFALGACVVFALAGVALTILLVPPSAAVAQLRPSTTGTSGSLPHSSQEPS